MNNSSSSSWNFGGTNRINGGANLSFDSPGSGGIVDLKALLNQALSNQSLNPIGGVGPIGGLGSGSNVNRGAADLLFGGGGNAGILGGLFGNGGGGGGTLNSGGNVGMNNSNSNIMGGQQRGGSMTDSSSSSSANGSYFDPFSSMNTFGFFNPNDPGNNLSSTTSGQQPQQPQQQQQQQQQQQHQQQSSMGNRYMQTKSPTYQQHANTTPHSPVYGASRSPTNFFSSNSNNQFNSSNSSSNFENKLTSSFPITTFSIDECVRGGGGGSGRNNENNSSMYNNSEDISSSMNGNSNNNNSSSSSSTMGTYGGRTQPRNYAYQADAQYMGRNEQHIEPRENHYQNNSREHREHGSSTDGQNNQGVRETGIIEKLLHSYGFIQCCERQARLFFHFSQFEGTIEHLKLGDPVEFEMTYDRRTGKPIASAVTKIGPEVVLSEERVTGNVTTALHHESSGELQGRISYENRGECFFLPYCQEDIEGNVDLMSGDTVSFQIATNQRSGNLNAKYVRLENPAQPVRYKGIVSSIKDSFGFIERADVAKEIFFHFSETRPMDGVIVNDPVEFNIQTRNSKEVACAITKLASGTVVFEDIGVDFLKGQVLKPIDKTQQANQVTIGPIPRSETMQGRLRYRGPDRQELEVVYGEKDQKGSFTIRHGDWVEFQLAIDRRDKQQRATNIKLLEESFTVSGERREEGVISALKDGFGFITCAERDVKMYFRFNELLDFNRQPNMSDDVEFTTIPDSTSPVRNSAIRIKYLNAGKVKFEIPLSVGIHGIVMREPSTSWVSQEALAGILPSLTNNLTNLGLPAGVTERLIQGLSSSEIQSMTGNKEQLGEPGIISYQTNGWNQETITFHWKDCKNLRNIRIGKKVIFDINQIRRNREIVASNIVASDEDGDNSSQHENQSSQHSNGIPEPSDSDTPIPNESSSGDEDSPQEEQELDSTHLANETLTRSRDSSSSLDSINDPSPHSKYDSYDASPDKEDSFMNGSKSSSQRFVMKGYIAALKDGFGFIETMAQDGEIFFHSSCLIGDFATLEVGQEVEYVVSSKGNAHGNGKSSADMVKPLPKGSISRAAVFPEILHGLVVRPLRGANPDQTEYTGLIDTADGNSYSFGIISLLNKKEVLQTGESVEFQLDAQRKPVNIRALRKKLRSAVEAVKGQYGFLSYELEDGKKLFFHMSEVKDHMHLNPGDEVEFVILQNPRNGKSSACSVVKIGESQRPERLLNRLSKLSVDESAPRLIVVRQPHGPDGTKGFNHPRITRITPGIVA